MMTRVPSLSGNEPGVQQFAYLTQHSERHQFVRKSKYDERTVAHQVHVSVRAIAELNLVVPASSLKREAANLEGELSQGIGIEGLLKMGNSFKAVYNTGW